MKWFVYGEHIDCVGCEWSHKCGVFIKFYCELKIKAGRCNVLNQIAKRAESASDTNGDSE